MNTLELTQNPTQLIASFYKLKTRSDVAELLEIDLRLLAYHLYVVQDDKKYKGFEILKKSGGNRIILAPNNSIKAIQAKLNTVLQLVYPSKAAVHGFHTGKSVLTNAKEHLRKSVILNLDLKDFFPSINFGRVRGMFLAKPYSLGVEAATTLAQICCFKNMLPQGAPTSPIVSNMVCVRLDNQLAKLAKLNACTYTRYADDMSFSTSRLIFPETICYVENGLVKVGAPLVNLINSNGFQLNEKKIRLMPKTRRQVVTGIKVNRKPNLDRRYIRNIRAMLHAWRKFGLSDAQKIFCEEKDNRHRSPWTNTPSFKKVLKGKIEYLGMIKGEKDPVFLNYREQLRQLDPSLVKAPPPALSPGSDSIQAILLTEGKTDAKHLLAALNRFKKIGEFLDMEIDIRPGEKNEGGDIVLLSTLKGLKAAKQPQKIIGMFDRDNLKQTAEALDDETGFVSWGNNVYSFGIPVPTHRVGTPEISIEFYYSDSDIQIYDDSGRRLYISNEFHKESGRLLSDSKINCSSLSQIRKGIKIIDAHVYNDRHESIALSKDKFAEKILAKAGSFTGVDSSEFRLIFRLLERIIALP